MSKLPLEYLKHIVEETEFIINEVTKISEDDFYINDSLKRAFVRSLEVIGEASKNIPEGFREKHSNVDWRNMARMRDKLIHHYFGIDYSIVWDVVKNEIPVLHSKILKIIQSEELNKS
ncbi:MAG: DUF86 domain-containing protein [bacterium]